MALELKDLIQLSKTVVNADRKAATSFSYKGENFDYDTLKETLKKEINAYCPDYQSFRRNKNDMFELIEQTIEDVLPRKVMEQYGMFAEIKTFNQGDRPVFTQKITEASKRRAKQFITKVGLAGRYEVFKLDGKTYEVPTSAIGEAAQISIEEFLDGRIQMSDVYDLVLEGLDETIYKEIHEALVAAINGVGYPAANHFSTTTFNETQFDRLLTIADSYGTLSTIYCTFEFAATMLPANTGLWSDGMKEEIWKNGYFATYKGHRVVILQQSYTDELNTTKVIDPSYAWIIPTGSTEKPVKVAFEGGTLVRDFENRDWSKEIEVYKKVGVTAILTNNICVYQNTSLTV